MTLGTHTHTHMTHERHIPSHTIKIILEDNDVLVGRGVVPRLAARSFSQREPLPARPDSPSRWMLRTTPDHHRFPQRDSAGQCSLLSLSASPAGANAAGPTHEAREESLAPNNHRSAPRRETTAIVRPRSPPASLAPEGGGLASSAAAAVAAGCLGLPKRNSSMRTSEPRSSSRLRRV